MTRMPSSKGLPADKTSPEHLKEEAKDLLLKKNAEAYLLERFGNEGIEALTLDPYLQACLPTQDGQTAYIFIHQPTINQDLMINGHERVVFIWWEEKKGQLIQREQIFTRDKDEDEDELFDFGPDDPEEGSDGFLTPKLIGWVPVNRGGVEITDCGEGVWVANGFGDGCFPVVAWSDPSGQVERAEILFSYNKSFMDRLSKDFDEDSDDNVVRDHKILTVPGDPQISYSNTKEEKTKA